MALSKQYDKLNAHANHQLGSTSSQKDGDWSGQYCLQACLRAGSDICKQ